jgi:hypothetical protein
MAADLPIHQYVNVDAGAISDGPQHGVWFAVQCNVGGVYGGHVLLDNGALYRNIPLHHLSNPQARNPPSHKPADLQLWDCYSEKCEVVEYDYLRGLQVRLSGWKAGAYLATIIPVGDAFSRHPEQAKEFVVAWMDTGRLVIRATNEIMFSDCSFMKPDASPLGLYRQTVIPSVERPSVERP